MDPLRRKQLEDMVDAASARALKKRKENEVELEAKEQARRVAFPGQLHIEGQRLFDHKLRLFTDEHPEWILGRTSSSLYAEKTAPTPEEL